MTRAAQRRERIIFLREGAERDAWNQPTGGWGAIGRARAAIYYGAGTERRQAAQEQGVQAASFSCLASELTRSITTADRLEHKGAVWNITAIVPIGRDIDFTATRAA